MTIKSEPFYAQFQKAKITTFSNNEVYSEIY